MRPVILSRSGTRTGPATSSARERSKLAWKVATSGTSAVRSACMESEGTMGSCRWTTSKRPASSHCATRAAVAGVWASRATDPL